MHEGTSPQAFAGIEAAGRKVRRPDLTFAVMDHSVPTKNRELPIVDDDCAAAIRGAGAQLQASTACTSSTCSAAIRASCTSSGPNLGITQPGLTIVCGDSHTSTHGAVGALAFGIGTSEVEHVLATQCLQQDRSKTMHGQLQRASARGASPRRTWSWR